MGRNGNKRENETGERGERVKWDKIYGAGLKLF